MSRASLSGIAFSILCLQAHGCASIESNPQPHFALETNTNVVTRAGNEIRVEPISLAAGRRWLAIDFLYTGSSEATKLLSIAFEAAVVNEPERWIELRGPRGEQVALRDLSLLRGITPVPIDRYATRLDGFSIVFQSQIVLLPAHENVAGDYSYRFRVDAPLTELVEGMKKRELLDVDAFVTLDFARHAHSVTTSQIEAGGMLDKLVLEAGSRD